MTPPAFWTLPLRSQPINPTGGVCSLVEGTGTNTGNILYMTSFTTIISSGGAVHLRDSGDVAVDFMRWGTSSVAVPAGTSFAGEVMPVPAVSQGSIARQSAMPNNDRTSDWCGQLSTMARPITRVSSSMKLIRATPTASRFSTPPPPTIH